MLKVMHNFVNGTKTRRFSIAKNKCIRLAGFTASILFVVLGFISVFPITNNKDEASATPEPSTSEVTITSSSSTASVDIIPGNSLGTFASSTNSSEVAFSVTTNNLAGYVLNIEGNDATGVLTNASTGTTLDSIASTTSEADFSANTSAGSNYNGKWGIKPSKYVDSGTVIDNTTLNNYLKAPTTSSFIAMDTTSVANPTTANNYTIGLGARVDYEKASGTYTSTFNIQAVARTMAYEITYSNGGVSDVTGTTATESNTAAISGVTLATSGFTRSTYTFAGWCDGTINTTTIYDSTNKIYYNPGTMCNGTSAYDTTNPNPNVYPANSSYKFSGKTIDPDNNNQVTLIAVWKPTTFDEAYGTTGTKYMQNSNMSTICSQVTINQYATLVDNRDSHQYTVMKLDDNKCWMLDNLDIDLVAKKSTLSSSNTNVTDAVLNYLKNGGGTTSNRYATSAVANWTTGQASYTQPLVNRSGNCNSTYNASTNPYPCLFTGSYSNTLDLSTKATSTSGPTTFGVGSTKLGTFYNYCAASAGYYCFSSGSASGDNSYDVCPSRWQMPSIANLSNLCTLIKGSACGSTTSDAMDATDPMSMQFKLSLRLSGGLYPSSSVSVPSRLGVVSFVWTSTNRDNSKMYVASGERAYMIIYNHYNNNFGYSIRCVAK